MAPELVANNPADENCAHTVFASKLFAPSKATVFFSNLLNRCLRQLGSTIAGPLAVIMFLTSWVSTPTLFHAVVNIVHWSPREAMGRIAASRGVAMMQKLFSVGDSSTRQFKSHSMGHRSFSATFNLTISRSVYAPCPQPAWAKLWTMLWSGSIFIDPFPKSFFKRGHEVSSTNFSSFAANLSSGHARYFANMISEMKGEKNS